MTFHKEERTIYKVYANIHDEDGTVHHGMLMNVFNTWDEAKDFRDKVAEFDWVSNPEIDEEVA